MSCVIPTSDAMSCHTFCANYALQHWLYGRLSLGIEHIQESRFHAFDGNG